MDGPVAHRSEPPGHVEVEDLAVLAEGRLPAEDCARVRAHLAVCEDCYEIFADMVRFLEEEEKSAAGQVDGQEGKEIKRFPFPDASRGSVRRWFPAAAAAVLVLGGWIGYRSLSGSSQVTVADVSQYLPADATQEQLVPQDVFRGSERGDPLPFRVGVELVDLQAALKTGDVDLAKDAALDVAALFQDESFMDEHHAFYLRLSQELSAGDLSRLSTQSERYADGALRDSFEPPLLDFGIWAEAARLAAVGRQPEFFRDRRHRKALSRFAGEESISQESRELLRGLRDAWNEPDYLTLAAQLRKIVRTEYRRSAY